MPDLQGSSLWPRAGKRRPMVAFLSRSGRRNSAQRRAGQRPQSGLQMPSNRIEGDHRPCPSLLNGGNTCCCLLGTYVVSRQEAPEIKSEIRSSKSETSGSSPNQSLPQRRNNVPPEISSTAFSEPHSVNLTSVCEGNRLRADPAIGCQQQHRLNRSVPS
jgi:hypothetical protein